MTWEEYIFDFKMYLRLERSLSENTVAGYVADIELLRDVVNGREPEPKKRGGKAAEPEKKHVSDSRLVHHVTREDIQKFITYQFRSKQAKRSQSRRISSLRTFFKYVELQKNAIPDLLFSGWVNPMLCKSLSAPSVKGAEGSSSGNTVPASLKPKDFTFLESECFICSSSFWLMGF